MYNDKDPQILETQECCFIESVGAGLDRTQECRDGGVIGRYLILQLNTTQHAPNNKYLTLCEVEITIGTIGENL